MEFSILQHRIGTKFWAHKSLVTALDTINSIKLRHLEVSQKVEESLIDFSGAIQHFELQMRIIILLA